MDAIRKYVSVLILSLFFFASLGTSFGEEPKKILSIEAYDMLNTVPDTFIIDVRTRAEYQFVGHPVGAYLFPYMFLSNEFQEEDDTCRYRYDIKNSKFVDEIKKVFQKSNNLLVICRDGTRSRLAAKDLADAGFKNVFDVTDGFEGALFPAFEDSNKDKFYRQLAKRNRIPSLDHRRYYGWQMWGLPWTYEIKQKYVYPPDLAPAKP